MWRYSDWRPGGERTTLGDLTFDSTIHCGNGHDFEQVGPNHYRFRARPGLVTYAWRFLMRIESPGDGREVILEVADFNHFGQELWQEQAAVMSTDGENWHDVGLDNLTLVPWTPTGDPEGDTSIDDGWHPPYGVQHRLRLDAPVIWFATGTPYTLQHSRDHLAAMEKRCRFFHTQEIGRAAFADQHGFPLLMSKVSKGSDEGKLRVMVIAGEHPSEFAGMYAAEGLLEELLRRSDLLSDFSFWVVPVVNVDGVAYGRSYHNLDPDDPIRSGVNLSRDWARRTQPETQAAWKIVEEVRPHCLVTLHNGRHRRAYEAYAPPNPSVSTLMRHLRKHLPLPLEHWRPFTEMDSLNPVAYEAGLTETTVLIETLILQKLPGCGTFKESYRRAGRFILRGLVAALRELYNRPKMLALAEPLGKAPLRFTPSHFLTQLPWFYYTSDFTTPCEHNTWNLELNGLPLEPAHYDLWLHSLPGSPPLKVVGGKRAWPGDDGWTLLPSLPVPARMLRLEFEHSGRPPFDDAVIAPEGTVLQHALAHSEPFTRYVRDTLAAEKQPLRSWQPFHNRLMSDSFGASDLEAMASEIVDWVATRQVLDPADHHYGAIWSEEDKYDARDAAAAAACFARRYRDTGDAQWLDRALSARRYVYRNQRREPGNAAHDGGFVHMVSGMWGVDFTRLHPPYPGIDGVDTGVIIHQLCSAADLGLCLAEEDCDVLRSAAGWIAANEPLPGMFLHHEGATHDCQNANAIGFSALARAYHTLERAGASPPGDWLAAVERGLTHYLEGQEAVGVWPYWFAQVGRRAGAFHFDNIPDHGIGLYHLTRSLNLFPISDWPGLHDALGRAARWYLCLSRLEPGPAHEPTINLEYDQRPELGDDICFSGFTWCRFTAAATLLRLARFTGEAEPWRHLALRLMEHVRRNLWQTSDPSHAPVVAHARPEAKLATWCQAAEWNAAMLGEMVLDLRLLEK
ncbi:MAG: M14 family zinc carboxypeptidase [Armatimonadia bacterium]